MSKPFAIVTGASSGIGLELATICAQEGFDLLIAAEIDAAADRCREFGAAVQVVQTDLATSAGVDQLWAAAAGRSVDALLANAGHGLGHAFLDQQTAVASITPAGVLAEQHRKMAEPGSAKKAKG